MTHPLIPDKSPSLQYAREARVQALRTAMDIHRNPLYMRAGYEINLEIDSTDKILNIADKIFSWLMKNE